MAMSSVNKTETFHFYPEEAFIFAAISDRLKCVEKNGALFSYVFLQTKLMQTKVIGYFFKEGDSAIL